MKRLLKTTIAVFILSTHANAELTKYVRVGGNNELSHSEVVKLSESKTPLCIKIGTKIVHVNSALRAAIKNDYAKL